MQKDLRDGYKNKKNSALCERSKKNCCGILCYVLEKIGIG
jgi:hypothetical protein